MALITHVRNVGRGRFSFSSDKEPSTSKTLTKIVVVVVASTGCIWYLPQALANNYISLCWSSTRVVLPENTLSPNVSGPHFPLRSFFISISHVCLFAGMKLELQFPLPQWYTPLYGSIAYIASHTPLTIWHIELPSSGGGFPSCFTITCISIVTNVPSMRAVHTFVMGDMWSLPYLTLLEHI